MVIDLTQRTATVGLTISSPTANMVQKRSGDSGHPPLKHELLSHEDGLQVIDGFYSSPEPPPAHHLSPIPRLDEPSDLPTVTDEHFGTLMADIEAMESIGSVIDFQAQPEDAPICPDSLEANRLTSRPCNAAAPPINSSAKHLHNIDAPELPMKSSSSKSELQAEMRHEELDASSPLPSTPAPVPFSLSKVRHDALAKRRAASSSPLAARLPVLKKTKRAPKTASSPLMLFEDLFDFSESSANSRHSGTLNNTTRGTVPKSRSEYISSNSNSNSNRRDHLVAGGGGGGDGDGIANVQPVSESESEDEEDEDEEEESEEEHKPPQIKPKRKHKVTTSTTTTAVVEEEDEEEEKEEEEEEEEEEEKTSAPPPTPAPARRHRPPMIGSNELKNLAMDTLHNNNSHRHDNMLLEEEKPAAAAASASGSRGRQQHASPTQRVTTRLQRRERMAALPGVSTKEAVQRRRRGSKRGRGQGRG